MEHIFHFRRHCSMIWYLFSRNRAELNSPSNTTNFYDAKCTHIDRRILLRMARQVLFIFEA